MNSSIKSIPAKGGKIALFLEKWVKLYTLNNYLTLPSFQILLPAECALSRDYCQNVIFKMLHLTDSRAAVHYACYVMCTICAISMCTIYSVATETDGIPKQ